MAHACRNTDPSWRPTGPQWLVSIWLDSRDQLGDKHVYRVTVAALALNVPAERPHVTFLCKQQVV